MVKIVYDMEVMQIISMFEQMTGAHVKDCIMGDPVVFVVHEAEIAKAIGKGGKHVRDLERKLKKRVKIVEFNSDVIQFTRNLVAPLELGNVVLEENMLILSAKDLKTRGLLIGRSASNLRAYEAVIQRYFPIKEMRVV